MWADAGVAREGRTVVLGIGNPLHGDDAVGLKVVEALERLPPRGLPDVDLALSTRGGFEVIDRLSGYDRAFLVDALAVEHPRPGRVVRLGLRDVAHHPPGLVGGHEIGVGLAFELAWLTGIPMPQDVTLLGIEISRCDAFGDALSAPVAAVVPALARQLLAELGGESRTARRTGRSRAPRPARAEPAAPQSGDHRH